MYCTILYTFVHIFCISCNARSMLFLWFVQDGPTTVWLCCVSRGMDPQLPLSRSLRLHPFGRCLRSEMLRGCWCWMVLVCFLELCQRLWVHTSSSLHVKGSQYVTVTCHFLLLFWNVLEWWHGPEITRERGVQLYHSDRFGSGSIPWACPFRYLDALNWTPAVVRFLWVRTRD